MAAVYILYSSTLDKYYVGSCVDVKERIEQHLSRYFPNAFTSKAQDWTIFLLLEDLSYSQARKIEAHIKRMKIRRFIENLQRHGDILVRLVNMYS